MSRELPILFSGRMVRAIMSGRKTQTRRLCPTQPVFDEHGMWHVFYPWGEGGHGIYKTEVEMRAEYDRLLRSRHRLGEPGDVLWVRETWQCFEAGHDVLLAPNPRPALCSLGFRATEADRAVEFGGPEFEGPWRSALHMPRWAARLFLLRTAPVRIERLQAISADDIRAEGIDCPVHDASICTGQCPALRDAWAEGWDAINGKRASWDSNPMVYVGEFIKTTKPREVA